MIPFQARQAPKFPLKRHQLGCSNLFFQVLIALTITLPTAKRVTIASDDSDETTDRDQFCEVIENRKADLVIKN